MPTLRQLRKLVHGSRLRASVGALIPQLKSGDLPASQEQTRARDNEAFASDLHRPVKLRFLNIYCF